MADFSPLTAELTELRTVREGVLTFIDRLVQQQDEAVAAALAANEAADLSAITDLTASLRAEREAFAAAITANTPAAEG